MKTWNDRTLGKLLYANEKSGKLEKPKLIYEAHANLLLHDQITECIVVEVWLNLMTLS